MVSDLNNSFTVADKN